MRFRLGGASIPITVMFIATSNLVIGSVAGDPLPCPKGLKGLIPADDMPALDRTFGWLSFGFNAPNLMDRRRSRSEIVRPPRTRDNPLAWAGSGPHPFGADKRRSCAK
jgi:hypothetical protein